MVREAEFPEHGSEEGAPLAVVGLVEVEQHRNVGTDVHHLDGGDRRLLCHTLKILNFRM